MQALQNILKFLNTQATTPKYLGIFHIIWIVITIAFAVVLCVLWKKEKIKNINNVILVTSLILIILGLYKQVVLSFTFNPLEFVYDFNNFPWHFLTVPIIVGIFIGATSGSINKHFLSYYATFGLLAGIWGMFKPNLFVGTVGLNIYSMLCGASFIALSVLILYSKCVRIEFRTYFKSLPVFAMLVGIAITFNELANLISSTQNISMFSIDRHSPSTSPVYSYVHNALLASGGTMNFFEYVICILFYFVFVSAVALVPFAIMIGIKKLVTTDFDVEYEKDDDLAFGIRKSEGLDDGDTQEIFKFNGKVNSKKNTYLKKYFENLRTNFGSNYRGSCGYVAAAMILSYYDTVLNEKIVPRQFDNPSLTHDNPDFQNSPGIRFYQPAFNPEEISYKDYVKEINKRKNSYLHECLIGISIDKKLNDAPKDKTSTEYKFGASFDDIKVVLKRYLKTVAGIKKSEYDIHVKDNSDELAESKTNEEFIENSNEIRNYAIRKVRKGFPVLLGILSGDEAHAVIAYDYDKKNDKLYCHFGWPSENYNNQKFEYTHVTPEEMGFMVYASALVLEFDERKISRTHTDNYEVVVNGALFYYCLDGRYTTPDDIVVEFGTGKRDLSIVGVYNKYTKEKLNIPESFGNVPIVNIEKGAFKNQMSIKQVFISCNITKLSKKVFYNCDSLKTIILPASIKKIGKKALANCESLTTIIYLGTMDEWQKIKKCGNWDKKTANYKVYCDDAVLIKPHANGQSELF